MESKDWLQKVYEQPEIACKIVFMYVFSEERSSDLSKSSRLQSKANSQSFFNILVQGGRQRERIPFMPR